MYVIQISSVGTKKVRVQTDICNFQLYSEECRKFGLKEQTEISLEVEQAILVLLTRRAKLRALHLLEKQDRTEYQLQQKLEEGDYPPPIVKVALDYVRSYGYIDDLHYAKHYVECREKLDSRKKIELDLKRRGISEDVIEMAFEDIISEDAEENALRRLIQKKYSNWDWSDRLKKEKAIRYLYSKGFHYEQISKALEQLSNLSDNSCSM